MCGSRLQQQCADARHEVLEMSAQVRLMHPAPGPGQGLTRSVSASFLDSPLLSIKDAQCTDAEMLDLRQRCKELERQCTRMHSLLERGQEACERWRRQGISAAAAGIDSADDAGGRPEPFALGPQDSMEPARTEGPAALEWAREDNVSSIGSFLLPKECFPDEMKFIDHLMLAESLWSLAWCEFERLLSSHQADAEEDRIELEAWCRRFFEEQVTYRVKPVLLALSTEVVLLVAWMVWKQGGVSKHMSQVRSISARVNLNNSGTISIIIIIIIIIRIIIIIIIIISAAASTFHQAKHTDAHDRWRHGCVTSAAVTTDTTTLLTSTTVHEVCADLGEGRFPAVPAGGEYVNQYDPDNQLRIAADPRRSNNYFIVIGDWGKALDAGGPGSCQLKVADLVKSYVRAQRQAGKTLLFIASVGDNFYWTGVTPEAWKVAWAEPYGVNDQTSPLFQVPWLAVYGNHDFGSHDPYAFCPHVQPKHILGFQAYSGNQLNKDRNPHRPEWTRQFWLPDYNYHYEIPDADLEVIAVDTNGAVDANGQLLMDGAIGGDARGRRCADHLCGGHNVSQDFLRKVARAGQELVKERARKNTVGTVLLIQHYPGLCPRAVFELALPPARRGKIRERAERAAAMALTIDLESLPVLIVPGKHRLLLKDLQNVRIQASGNRKDWQTMYVTETAMLRQYLNEAPDKKSWKPPLSSCRIGFNDKGVFLHEDHVKRYFGLLESAARHLVPAVETQEAIPKYYRSQNCHEMMDSLAAKVQTVTDDMRKQVVQSTFRAADTNGNGTLSRHEIGSLMRRLAVSVTAQEIDTLMKEADVNRDDQIDYEEFATWMLITRRGLISAKLTEDLGSAADVVRASFRVWDSNGNGLISKAEVRKLLLQACKMKAKDVEILAEVMDTDDDGQIDYDEFVSFLFPRSE
ncbi:Calmodulin-like protein [Symbiodinium microadriaticum]|uniref:Calmodulin n=1 Tax=Symbiodinium microadriaticum TaxID=2951 RepID=A0A1Q9DD39_SYMMI|nr:Calmodulin-like protein [Symbiodinium microadriaticum]